jgi:glutamate synthase (NADPH/NADH) large chain
MVGIESVVSELEQTGAEQELIAQGKGRKRHLGMSDEALLKSLIEKHLRYTGSTVALAIMDNWDTQRKHFVKVFPHEYKRALTDMYAESIKAKSGAKEAVAK